MIPLLLSLLACEVSQDTGGLVAGDSGLSTDCLVHVDHVVGEMTCTLIEDGNDTPVVWYGRDVDAEHPLAIRLRTDDEAIIPVLEAAAEAWNTVLANAGVALAYDAEDTAVDSYVCALETLEDLPEQVAGFCIATVAEWEENIEAIHQDDAYVTRLNSPCDGTLRSSMTVLHPLWAGELTQQAIAKALGHLTSVVAIDSDEALMADHWEGAATPQDALEGACAAWQYRALGR
jgi:hypothetical protein